jgi:Zn-dependent membrane protease YugP
VVGIGFAISLLVQGWLRATYAKWSRVRNSLDLPGAHVCRHLLDKDGLPNSQVTMQRGILTDHYDPRTKNIALSERIYREPSIASAAIAAHETGHAIQDKVGYGPMRFRSAVIPIVQLGAQYGPYAILGGWLFGYSELVLIGFLMFAGAMLFQLLTLPVNSMPATGPWRNWNKWDLSPSRIGWERVKCFGLRR